jgi:hypothetical protein
MANETTLTSLAELVAPERLAQIILEEHRPTSVFDLLSWRIDVSANPATTIVIPRWDKSDVPAGTKAETDEFTNVEATTSESTITAGVVGLSRELTDPAAQDAGVRAEQLIRMNLRGMAERLTSDLLALHTSATNASDFNGSNLDLDKWGTATAAFHAQYPHMAGMARVAVLSTNAVRDLKKAIRNAGGAIESTGRGLGLLSNVEGGIFMFEGYTVIESGLVPQFDATNDSNALMVVGTDSDRVGSALARGIWWDVKHELDRHPKKQTTDIVTSARYGVAISDQSNLRELITKKAA